jgi:two-component system, chemotaxis family, response regulator WspF
VKIAVAHASITAGRALELLLRNQRYELTWVEADGRRALELLASSAPEVLLLDGALRSPSSAEVTRAARAAGATVLLVANSAQQHTSAIYEAMQSGAVDVARCPALDARGEVIEQAPMLAKLRVVARLLGRSQSRPFEGQELASRDAAARPLLIAIGASTGGPNALHRVLSMLPVNLEAAIVLVQHVDSALIGDLASFLQSGTARRIELATPGALPTAGSVLLAATNDHLVLTAGRAFRYEPEPRALPYRPSVDVLFASLAQHWPHTGIAVLLTGMGRDGAQGLKRLRELGWHTLAQDEDSSIVYGMPKAAAELGAASRILALDDIAQGIVRAAFDLKLRRA